MLPCYSCDTNIHYYYLPLMVNTNTAGTIQIQCTRSLLFYPGPILCIGWEIESLFGSLFHCLRKSFLIETYGVIIMSSQLKFKKKRILMVFLCDRYINNIMSD